jgi:hypothetical protein
MSEEKFLLSILEETSKERKRGKQMKWMFIMQIN